MDYWVRAYAFREIFWIGNGEDSRSSTLKLHISTIRDRDLGKLAFL